MAPRNSMSWDAGRFLKTLAYFDVIPLFSCLQRLFKGQSQDPSNFPTGANRMGVVLVAGAASNLGQQMVQQLLTQGYQVRSLVPDLQHGQAMETQADLLVADLAQPATLTPKVLGNINAIIYCPNAVPSAGSIHTPISTAAFGVQNLVEAAVCALSQPGETTIFDFTYPSANLRELWGAVDDVVMGGVSQSEIRFDDRSALFMGNVSTANSGGFASIRTRNFPAIALGNYQGIKLRVKGDGNRYKFLLRTEEKWDGIAYSHSFDTVADQWIDVEIPFSAFIPVFRAKTVPSDGPIDPNRICSCQFMLSKFEYDGGLNPHFTPGRFQLQIASVKAYGGPILPQFVLLSVPIATQLDQSESDLASLSQDEETVRSSGIPHTIIRLHQSTTSPGDRFSETASPKAIAELCVQALAQPEACNCTFEKAVN